MIRRPDGNAGRRLRSLRLLVRLLGYVIDTTVDGHYLCSLSLVGYGCVMLLCWTALTFAGEILQGEARDGIQQG